MQGSLDFRFTIYAPALVAAQLFPSPYATKPARKKEHGFGGEDSTIHSRGGASHQLIAVP